AEAASGADGLASFSRPAAEPVLVLAQSGEDIALVDLRQPALDLSEFAQGARPGLSPEIFIYGPRDIFRPGETLEVAALIRDADARGLPAMPLAAEIQQPDGSRTGHFVWQGDAAGFYRHAWAIPQSAPLGTWQLRVTGPDGQVRQYRFRVEDFLPERLRLELAAPAGRPAIADASQDLALAIQGDYLYGAPAAGNRLSLTVKVQADREPLAQELPGFEFGNLREEIRIEEDAGEAFLDPAGHLAWSTPSRWARVASPAVVKVEASLFDQGGRPVNRLFLQRIWPHDAAIGVRPASFARDQPAPAGSLAEFEVLRASRVGELVAGTVDLRLVAEQRSHFWTRTARGWELGYTAKEYTVHAGTVVLAAGDKARVSVPVESGFYRLELLDQATGGITSCRFQAGESYWYDETKPEVAAAPRPDQVLLQLNQARYQEGETAKVRITPPFDAEVLLAVEADRRLWSQRLNVPAAGIEVGIPIDPVWARHDLYVTALALRPAAAGEALGPGRALGLLHLPLDRSDRHLEVSLTAPPRARPSQPHTVRIQVQRPPAGKKAWVTLAAVDEGVLALTRFATPDAFAWFFAPRRFHPDLKDLYHRIIENRDGQVGALRFGGDEPLSLTGKQPDEGVEILSRFLGPVELDASGQAEITFDLPDFNGTMRLMALAYTDDAYGAADQEVTVAAPLVAELAASRFLAGGDQSRLTLALQNLSGRPQSLAVHLTVGPPLAGAAPDQALTLAAMEKRVLVFPVQAETTFAKADIDLTVEGLRLAEEEAPVAFHRHWSLPVRPAYPAQTRRGVARLAAGDTFVSSPGLIQGLAPASLEARLFLSPQPPLDLAQHLRELLGYPYGCLEQTTSAALTLALATPEALAALGLAEEALTTQERADRIRAALDRLSTMQKHHGGFVLWEASGPEEHWLTAYAADFLVTAREAGFAVDERLLARTVERLGFYLRSQGALAEERWSDEPRHFTLAYKAYAGYVLSRLNRARLADLRSLFDLGRQEAKSPLPLVHLGLALRRQGDHPRGEEALAQALAMSADWGRQPFYGDYGSPIRDQAQLLALLFQEGRWPADGVDRLFALASELGAKPYLSTQERQALFLLGTALAAYPGAAWQGELRLAGASQPLAGGQRGRRLGAAEAAAGLEFALASGGPVFLQYTVSGYPSAAEPPEASDRLAISRTLRDRSGAVITGNRFRAGDLVLVDLAVSNRYSRVPDLLVVDLLAAGFELESQSLEASIKLDDILVEGETVAAHLAGQPLKMEEFRADRYVAALDLPGYRTAARHLFYLMRAVTPGRYRLPQPACEDMYRPGLRATGASGHEWLEILGRDEAAPVPADLPAIGWVPRAPELVVSDRREHTP
ncbi:MAG: alpha-2-macroglobulin, partial [Thermodesulfobacteriota bacterium]